MRSHARPSRLLWIAAAALVALLGLLFASRGRGAPEGPSGSAAPEAQAAAPAEPPVIERRPRAADPAVDEGGEGATDPSAPALDDSDGAEYPLDLAALRARLPDNLYWKLGAPTEDPAVLQMRAEEELRWNELLGKVQSNTASEEEIRSYYDHRRELSEDYLEFARVVLEEHGDKLPERDRGLYELSARMHRDRLAEIPRQIEDALARKRDQDARREAWRRGEQGE